MPKRQSKQAARNASPRKRKPTTYRLACCSCDREDFDGVHRLPKDWDGIHRVQTLAESRMEVEQNDSQRSAFEWYTHVGECPECQTADR